MDQRSVVQKIVKSVMEDQFEGIEIDAVKIEPAVDHDGDEVLLIAVIFESGGELLNPRKASGLTRHLLPKLAKEGISGFPVLSFISKSDIGKKKTAAA